MRSRPLFARFFLPYFWITTALVVLMGLYGCYLVRQFYLEQLAIDLEARARLCAKQIAVPLDGGDVQAVDALCKELGSQINTRVTVILNSGKVVGDTDESPQKMENHGDRAEVKEAIGELTVAVEDAAEHAAERIRESRREDSKS